MKLTCCFATALVMVVAASNSAAAQSVQGTAVYPERMAWPPTAVFEALLEDISRPDAVEVIGRTRITNPPNPPIPFAISYDRTQIQNDHVYAVRARILIDGREMFVTDTYSVLTHNSGGFVNLMIYPVNSDRVVFSPKTVPSLPSLGSLPATYVGALPCADCPGIFYQLNLFPDRVFVARSAYQGTDAAVDDIGRWVLSSDGKVVVLKGARGTAVMFAILDDATLGILDDEGAAIDYGLRRSAQFELLEPRLSVSGMYRNVAGARMLTECTTGWRLLVAEDHDGDVLDAAYARMRQQPGEELKVHVNGRVAVQPRADTAVRQPVLVVDQFKGITPGETCGAPFSALALENTYWRATQLEGQPLPPMQPGGQAYLIFEAGGRVSGSDSCNRLAGAYDRNHDAIRFGPMASTRIACSGTSDIERAFGDAVTNASFWRILGDRLELYDAGGARLARFEPGITASR